MFQASLPVRFWCECVLTACHLINRIPSSVLHGKTPFGMLYDVPPNFSALKVFGSLCFAHKILRDKHKFGERSRQCVFMGYSFGQKGWRVYDIQNDEFFVSKDVVFEESEFPFASIGKQTSSPMKVVPQQIIDYSDDDFF